MPIRFPIESFHRLILASMVAIAAMLSVQVASAQDKPPLPAIVDAWIASPHADGTKAAFTHWDKDGAIPEACATCHSSTGFRDFIGADGSDAGKVDKPARLGSLVDCAACHNSTASKLDAVTFPSGETIEGVGKSAVCMTCHSGRESGDKLVAMLSGAEDDTVNPELGFVNIHYRAAAATMMGSAVRGGYQYEGKQYVQQFAHVKELNTCTACHSPHKTTVIADGCATCHKGIENLKAIRTTPGDIDGDGDDKEGIAGEIATLHDKLYDTIKLYAKEVAGAPVVYDAHAYPYFFHDTDGDGQVGAGEAAFPNKYKGWTPRLLRAAYNYQFVAKDPGAYSHNPRYAIELMFDSLEDLSAKAGVDMTGMTRP